MTDGAKLLFNERAWGTYAYQVPADGWIITKLPVGRNHLARVGFSKFMRGNFFHDFTPAQTGFVLPAGQRVYYVGDVVIDWSSRGFKPSMMFGLAGAIVDQMSSDGTLRLTVNDNRAAAVQELARRYRVHQSVTPALLARPTTVPAAHSQPAPVPGSPPIQSPARRQSHGR